MDALFLLPQYNLQNNYSSAIIIITHPLAIQIRSTISANEQSWSSWLVQFVEYTPLSTPNIWWRHTVGDVNSAHLSKQFYFFLRFYR